MEDSAKTPVNWNQWLVVIPARLASTRLPNKPLQDLCGKPLIVRVFERISPLVKQGATVLVATDEPSVQTACEDHGVPVAMTSKTHPSGTDRVFEVSNRHDTKFVLNVQGDEPFVNLSTLESLARRMVASKNSEMGTVVYRNTNPKDFVDPNIVKTIISQENAQYFSRSPIPYHRDQEFSFFWQHIGIYAFTKKALKEFCNHPPHPWELLEKLEQLRALGNGIGILTVETHEVTIGIDTPQDLEDACDHYKKSLNI
ncbi:MAG: 3-deoxy-manno-octulosonate cytidylyltransferase [Pseudobacteriovorax sp.]|nr:3-deoxy-manno-octulosonate cytidylyltransferase [Pseudobacteriovorax sp.]